MATGARTATTVNGTPTKLRLSFSLFDSDGQQRTDSYNVVPAAGTNANIEAYAAALQGVSAASLFNVGVTAQYSGAKNKINAATQEKDSVADNAFVTTRIPTLPNTTITGYIPAPDTDIFISGTPDLDTSNTALLAYVAALLAVLGGAGRVAESTGFNERRKSGSRTAF